MPNSTVVVEAAPTETVATVSIPLSELEVALGAPVSLKGTARAALESYVRAHIAVTAADGQLWVVTQLQIEIDVDDHPQLKLSMRFLPPGGGRHGASSLRYDAVNHRVASHYVLVYSRVGDKLVPLGRLQSPATTLKLP